MIKVTNLIWHSWIIIFTVSREFLGAGNVVIPETDWFHCYCDVKDKEEKGQIK